MGVTLLVVLAGVTDWYIPTRLTHLETTLIVLQDNTTGRPQCQTQWPRILR
jgi:hypothetical protein